MSRHLATLLAVALVAAGQPAFSARAVESAGWQPRDVRYPGTIQLQVDATDVERGFSGSASPCPWLARGA